MRNILFLTLVLVGCMGPVACDKKSQGVPVPGGQWTNRIPELVAHNKAKTTITQGISGTLTFKTGNCMPGAGIAPGGCVVGGCNEYPIRGKVSIYAYTLESNTVRDQEGYYTSISTPLIKTVHTDAEGFYQLSLPPGTYSVFLWHDSRLYANGSDGQGGIQPVTVSAGTVSYIKTTIDRAVY